MSGITDSIKAILKIVFTIMFTVKTWSRHNLVISLIPLGIIFGMYKLQNIILGNITVLGITYIWIRLVQLFYSQMKDRNFEKLMF